jgi:predicted metalloprotease with PDZ domain
MPELSPETTTTEESLFEPILKPEARVVRADRSLAAMVLVVCTLGGMGIGFGFAMYLMRAQLAFAPAFATRTVVVPTEHSTWLGAGARSFNNRGGTLITRVYAETGAQAAGLRAGDIVTTVEGEEIDGADELDAAIRSRPPGAIIQLGVERNGQPLVLRARLGQR